MLGRVTIFAAAVLYLAVIGCVVLPAGSGDSGSYSSSDFMDDGDGGPPVPVVRAKLKGLPYRGVAMQIQKVDKIGEYKKGIDEAAALGADAVSIVVDCRQENGSSARIFMDLRMTPTAAQLSDLIAHAKSRNLRVVLMPIVLLDRPRGTEWRGMIKPEVWEDWFDSYRGMMRHYAEVAQGAGADVLVVGSELVSTESRLDEWTKTIRMVRGIYKGQLTYSSNWDHYRAVPFWDQLDLIGMNSYWNMGKVGGRTLSRRQITVEAIEQRWAEIQQDLLAFQAKQGKPLLLLEVGWCSLDNAAHEPWDYTSLTARIDLDLQRKLYEGFFRSWWGKPGFGGFMVWEWTIGDGGRDDRGYTPEGKPAEKVLKEWMAKPAWQVQ